MRRVVGSALHELLVQRGQPPTTVLYAIDSASDTLSLQNPPNDGTLMNSGAAVRRPGPGGLRHRRHRQRGLHRHPHEPRHRALHGRSRHWSQPLRRPRRRRHSARGHRPGGLAGLIALGRTWVKRAPARTRLQCWNRWIVADALRRGGGPAAGRRAAMRTLYRRYEDACTASGCGCSATAGWRRSSCRNPSRGSGRARTGSTRARLGPRAAVHDRPPRVDLPGVPRRAPSRPRWRTPPLRRARGRGPARGHRP